MARRPKLNQREINQRYSLAREVQRKRVPFLYPIMMELVVAVVAVVEEQEVEVLEQEVEDLVEGQGLEVDKWLEGEVQVLV